MASSDTEKADIVAIYEKTRKKLEHKNLAAQIFKRSNTQDNKSISKRGGIQKSRPASLSSSTSTNRIQQLADAFFKTKDSDAQSITSSTTSNFNASKPQSHRHKNPKSADLHVRGRGEQYILLAANFAPGTSLSDIKSVVAPDESYGLIDIKIVHLSPTGVDAELVFNDPDTPAAIVKKYNGKRADGHPLYMKIIPESITSQTSSYATLTGAESLRTHYLPNEHIDRVQLSSYSSRDAYRSSRDSRQQSRHSNGYKDKEREAEADFATQSSKPMLNEAEPEADGMEVDNSPIIITEDPVQDPDHLQTSYGDNQTHQTHRNTPSYPKHQSSSHHQQPPSQPQSQAQQQSYPQQYRPRSNQPRASYPAPFSGRGGGYAPRYGSSNTGFYGRQDYYRGTSMGGGVHTPTGPGAGTSGNGYYDGYGQQQHQFQQGGFRGDSRYGGQDRRSGW